MNESDGLIVANWKQNGSSAFAMEWLAEYESLSQSFPVAGAEVVVCPPYPYVPLLAVSAVRTGAQDVSGYFEGAYTGEVSISMLADYQLEYVIVGHSERRAIFGESDAWVARKAFHVLNAGLTPIVCVGETLEERESEQTFVVLERQLSALLEQVNPNLLSSTVIAYEPIWAIGTGNTATPEQANEVHAWIYDWLAKSGLGNDALQNSRVIYGGSVKPENARSLFAMPHIRGALVGGASLRADVFYEIVKAWSC